MLFIGRERLKTDELRRLSYCGGVNRRPILGFFFEIHTCARSGWLLDSFCKLGTLVVYQYTMQMWWWCICGSAIGGERVEADE